jgi:hypothetical protein
MPERWRYAGKQCSAGLPGTAASGPGSREIAPAPRRSPPDPHLTRQAPEPRLRLPRQVRYAMNLAIFPGGHCEDGQMTHNLWITDT